MPSDELDEVDEGILFLLQEDARNVTTKTIGKKTGVAPSTVANRIQKLEDAGVIQGYRPDIDYGRTEFDHHLIVVGTAPPDERSDLSEAALDVTGVVAVREFATADENLSMELIARSQSSVEQAIDDVADLGVAVERTEILKRDLRRPFDGFGRRFTSE